MPLRVFAFGIALAVLLAVGAMASSPGICLDAVPGVHCGPGNGRQTAGGSGKVSHRGWPAITGAFIFTYGGGRRVRGSALNDEILGGDGSDTLIGGDGNDVLWADQHPVPRNHSWQHDALWGGAGRDFLYSSHGSNVIHGGPGNDVIHAYWGVVNHVYGGPGNDTVWVNRGSGLVDCGPGDDTVHVRLGPAFRLRGCEHVVHYCAFGADGHGGCLKPGHAAGVSGAPARGGRRGR